MLQEQLVKSICYLLNLGIVDDFHYRCLMNLLSELSIQSLSYNHLYIISKDIQEIYRANGVYRDAYFKNKLNWGITNEVGA